MAKICLNALSGIGGVRTDWVSPVALPSSSVLMPCRALEAFGLIIQWDEVVRKVVVLMPCRALEAFGLKTMISQMFP